MSDPAPSSRVKPTWQPTRLEIWVRDIFGWMYIRGMDWVHAGGPAKALPRARFLTKIFLPIEEKMARRNVPIAFGAERAPAIHAERFEYLSRMMAHSAFLKAATGPADVLSQVNFTGEEHLAAAMAEGRGVLVVSAHAGTWWHAPTVTAALGHTGSTVVLQHLPAAVVRFLDGLAVKLGSSLSFVRGGAYESARAAFAAKRAFYLSFDFASRPDRSVHLPANERAEIPVDTGPGVMAIRHKVPVVWVDSWHDESGRSCLKFYPPIHAGKGTDYPDPVSVIRYFMDRLGEQISQYPGQWWLLGHGHLKEHQTAS